MFAPSKKPNSNEDTKKQVDTACDIAFVVALGTTAAAPNLINVTAPVMTGAVIIKVVNNQAANNDDTCTVQ